MAYFRTALLSFALALTVGVIGCAETSSTGAQQESLRGTRYCEVLAVIDDGGFRADVYGTQGLSECPEEQWGALDPLAIREELGALATVMNGPRYWVIDRLTAFSEVGESRFFGDLEMRKIASIALSPSDLAQTPYTERGVLRDTEFVFEAGSEVYELIAPNGTVYVMQSYSQIVDDTLSEADLPSLGDWLELPEGWTYRTRVIDEDYVVVDEEGVATVLQDELQNTYQLAVSEN
jgi:hypothetical protein